MDFFGKTIDGSRSLYLDELTVTWNADILATSLFSKPAIFDTTLKITETLTLGDTNSVTLSPNFITTPYSLFLPPTQGTSNTFLENNGSGVLTWRSSLTLPYVTSVALTAPSFLTVSGSPITSSGTLSLTYSGTPLPVLNGGTGVTTSTGTGNNVLSNDAYLTGADLTDTYLDGTITLAEPLSTSNGGTGLDTVGSNNQVLTSNGSNLLWTTPTTGTVTSIALTTPDFLTVYGSPITSSGTFDIEYSGIPLPVINGGTGVDLSTGEGRVVLNTNPILDSAVLTNDTISDGTLTCQDKVTINSEFVVNLLDGEKVEILGSGSFNFAASNSSVTSFDSFNVILSGAAAANITTLGLGAITLNASGAGLVKIQSLGIGGVQMNALGAGDLRISASLPLVTYGGVLEMKGSQVSTQGAINLFSNVPITGNVSISSLATTSMDATTELKLGSATCTKTTIRGISIDILGTSTTLSSTTASILASTSISMTTPTISLSGATGVNLTGPTTVTGTLTATTALTTLGVVTAGAITSTALNSPTLNTPTLLALNAPTIVVNTALLNILNPIFPNACAVNIATAGGAFNLATGGGAATFTMGAGLFSVVTVLGRIQLYTGAGITGDAIDIKALIGNVNLGTGGGNVNITSGSGAVLINASIGGLQLGSNSTTNRLCRIYSNISNGAGAFEEGDLYLETVDRGFNGTCDFRINTSQGKVGKIGHYSKGNFEIASNLNGTVYNASTTPCLSLNTSFLTSSYTLTFPPNAGSASQLLSTNGSGVLSWAPITGSGSVVRQGNATLVSTTLNGLTTFNQGLNVLGGTGSTGWTAIFSNISTNSNAGLSNDGTQNGFNFGWNVSGGDGENVMTYFTGGVGAQRRLDICSWNGTTRTTTLSINNTGGVTFGSNLYPTIQGTSGQVLTTNGSGTLSWQTPSPPGTGTVTSVSATVPSFLSITGSPITASGTLAIGLSGTALPTLNGGTGLTAVGTNGQVLTSNGSTLSWQTPAAPGTGTVTSVAASVPSFLTVTGSPITASGTLAISYSGTALPVLNGGTGATTATGTGAVVLQDDATMGDLTVTSGLQILGFGGATGWTSILSNIGTGNNTGIRGDGAQNGFNFGWNVSGGQAESIITYGTLGFGRLDICSWNGTTRTTTLSINSTGGVTFGSNLYPTIQGTSGQVLTTNGSGTLSWQTPSSPGTGTVTSVSASVPSFLSIAGSPITTSGTLAISYSGTALPVLNGGTGVTTSTGTLNNVLSNNPTLHDTILNGITTATRGLNVLGGTGSTGWTSILSGIGTGNNTGIRGDGTQNGFNFGWNVSGGQAESIITYGTLGFGRLDICSWNGTTRTTTLSINSSGVVSIPLGAMISSGVTVNGDSLFTSSVTINGITRTPQMNGSGTSGDLTITSTRNLATNVSNNYELNAANINLNSANPVFSNNRRIDNVYGYMEFFLGSQDVNNNNESNLFMTQTRASGFPLTLTASNFRVQNTYGQVILVTATFAVTRRGANNTGSSQSWIQIGDLSNSRRLGFGTPLGYSAFGSAPFPIGLGIRYGTAMFALDVNEYFVLRVYQDSGATQPFNGIDYNTTGEVPTYLYISYAGI